MSKCLVLFVEGETEVEFYKQVVANARKLHPQGRFDTNIEYRCIKGIGGFQKEAVRKFVKDVKVKYEDDCVFTIALCRDTDVFEFAQRPPVRWNEVEMALFENGAAKVIHVEARHCIEDWFLYDVDGIISFLRLNKKTKISGKSGYEKLQQLYKQANKVYYKGIKSNGMIGRLNIGKIADAVKEQLNPLYQVLGVEKE
ncbi:MAG: DUF4276 family protein [Lachnospiraceae bacterium]|nr:DUF4276 family protein [Lachnospiraceae bacterium]